MKYTAVYYWQTDTRFLAEYHVGSEYGWSPIFRFTALEPRPEGGFIYAVYGDLGNVNARSLGKIQQFAQRGKIDMVLHIGKLVEIAKSGSL